MIVRKPKVLNRIVKESGQKKIIYSPNLWYRVFVYYCSQFSDKMVIFWCIYSYII